MERIVIEVDKITATKWRNSSKQEKRKLATVLKQALNAPEKAIVNEPAMGYARPSEDLLRTHYERVQKTLPAYRRFMNNLSKKAAERGLTEEILNELLRKDD